MRKLVYHVACTLDGFIAREDGSLDGFLEEGEHIRDYLDSLREYDAVLMGRRTYEVGLRLGVTSPYPAMEQYVISRTLAASPDPGVELVREDPGALVRRLKGEPGKDIYLCGGADLASHLLAEGLIDEIIVKLNPVVFGKGIPLFSKAIRRTALELISSRTYANGVVVLRYRVMA
jgi:dihydrofolate reductase